MKIETVKISEFKCLKDFEANINASVVLFKGDNGLGKTSAIRFIEIALGQNTHIPPNTFGKGEVVLNHLGEQYTISVEISDGKSKLKIKGSDGLRDNTKGAVAKIVGANKFDPDEFVRLSKDKSGRKAQVEQVKSFFPEEVRNDLAKYERDIAANFEERTEVGRDIKRVKGALESNELYKKLVWRESEPYLTEMVDGKIVEKKLEAIKKVDVQAAFAELTAANDKNRVRSGVEARIIEREKEISDINTKIEALKKELLEQEAKRDELKVKNEEAHVWLLASDNARIDTSTLENTIKQADSINKQADEVAQVLDKISELRTLEEQYGDLTVKIESGRDLIQTAVMDNASVIMDGIGYDYENEQLTYNGIPVHPDSMSTSEIMELSLRLKYAENSEAPIFLQQTESLGAERWKRILDFAKEHGLQVIGEQVVRGEEELIIEIVSE